MVQRCQEADDRACQAAELLSRTDDIVASFTNEHRILLQLAEQFESTATEMQHKLQILQVHCRHRMLNYIFMTSFMQTSPAGMSNMTLIYHIGTPRLLWQSSSNNVLAFRGCVLTIWVADMQHPLSLMP